MVFSSLTFLCVFLPIVSILYWILPSIRWQNGWLLIASLLFYSYGEPVYVLLMIGSAFVNYVFALILEGMSGGAKKAVLCLDVVANLVTLGIFKYSGMLADSLSGLLHHEISFGTIALPLGISFFTFQAMSYVIDVYRGENKAEKNFFRVLLYITFFPQLIAGPIIQYHDIAGYLSKRTKDIEQIARGFRRFCFGLAKKVFISNAMGLVVDQIYAGDQVNAAIAWVGAIGYMLQIYYDFSGYSDMAIGLGGMFGFVFPENFNYPYYSSSIKEFWRRWHMSLSNWFKEYLYIPLGGNRKGAIRTVCNKWIVFFCTGLWHGANWTFVLWGLYHGFFSMLEQIISVPKNKVFKGLGHVYACLVVCVGFVIFRADTLTQAGVMLRNMATGFHTDPQLYGTLMGLLSPQFICMLILGLIGAMPVKVALEKFFARTATRKKIGEVVSYGLALVLLALCLCNLAGNGYNPFIYFRF